MKYVIPESVQEALQILTESGGKAIVLAGGTDLVLDRHAGKKPADILVDVMRIPELSGIRIENDEIVIGAAVTLTEIARCPLILERYPSLAKGCGTVGSLQIRNAATLTGNVISAQPAADGAMALAPLNPTFVIEGPDGTRTQNMEEMYAGFGRSAIDPYKEMVTQIRIPCPAEHEAASFVRLELRKSLSLPMLNTAAMARVEDGVVKMVRITTGPVGVGPKRAKAAEEWLTGKEWTPENLRQAAKLVMEDANPRSNPLRGSKEYREDTLPVIVRRALEEIGAQLGLESGAEY